MALPRERTIVIGAGIGGLTAAVDLACAGHEVLILERADSPGGKMRNTRVGGTLVAGGPTVFTMRWVFDALFAQAGSRLEDHVRLRRAEILARHAWDPGGSGRASGGAPELGSGAPGSAGSATLDLYADLERSADAISAFSGPAEARAFLAFSANAKRTFETLRDTFICAPRPSVAGLVNRIGIHRLGLIWSIRSLATLWSELGKSFSDPRLQQLFGRYATYCGSSPYKSPATLMLIAHVEQEGVWYVDGGMHALAGAVADLAQRQGAMLRTGAHVAGITVEGRRVTGVRLADGSVIAADNVVFNGDSNALARCLLGSASSRVVRARTPARHSLSAFAWTARGRADGFPLTHHNVFFSQDYAREFEDIFSRRTPPHTPTIYVCAQDRADAAPGHTPDADGERFLLIANAPARPEMPDEEIQQCQSATQALLQRCGLTLSDPDTGQPLLSTGELTGNCLMTGPAEFSRLFPGSDGALYGQAAHGWQASFSRPAAGTPISGLVLAGGTTHPGPGVPMAALSGRLAAMRLISDRASIRTFHKVAMPGGTVTRSATTAPTG